MAAATTRLLPPVLLVAACGDNVAGIDAPPAPPAPVKVSANIGYLPVILFQDQSGITVHRTETLTDASADLPDGGTVIAYGFICGFENFCTGAAYAVRGVQPGDTVTFRDWRDTRGPHIQVQPGPVQTAVMDCIASGLGFPPFRVEANVSLLVIGPNPQTFPHIPSLVDPSDYWVKHCPNH